MNRSRTSTTLNTNLTFLHPVGEGVEAGGEPPNDEYAVVAVTSPGPDESEAPASLWGSVMSCLRKYLSELLRLLVSGSYKDQDNRSAQERGALNQAALDQQAVKTEDEVSWRPSSTLRRLRWGE